MVVRVHRRVGRTTVIKFVNIELLWSLDYRAGIAAYHIYYISFFQCGDFVIVCFHKVEMKFDPLWI